MSTFKKVLAGTAALAGLISLAAPANAAIVAGTANAYVSGAAAPAATVAVAGPSVVVNGTGAGFTGAFIAGNTLTFTLSQGTFAVLPTVGIAGGGSLTYISGGAGQNFVTYQLGGTLDVAQANNIVTLSNISVNSIASVSGGSAINIVLSDGANGLGVVAAAAKTWSVATFTDPYTVTFAAAGTAPQVNLSAAAPGSRYTNTNVADLGTITIVPAAALRNWANTADTGAAAATSGLTVTVPSGVFNTATFSGSCLTAPAVVSTVAANVVTLPAAALTTIGTTGTGANCTVNVALNGPTAGTALLGAGAASASLTVALSPTTTGQTGTTRTFSQTLTPVTYAGGSVVNAGYSVGSDAGYGYYINVSNGATAGPVIVSASVGGQTGTAVLSQSLAANTAELYSIETIRTALVGAGMAAGTFGTAADRGNIQVVVPTNAKVTPLLLNKTNGQVVEISRQ